MPRVIRDSDEEVETKNSTRRTRASSAASSASVTDSPARRATRSNKQLAIIDSSPESLDDSNSQPRVRATRSRTATLDKSATAGIAKNLRSRKNSASSNLSETIDLESETTQKRVTRKTAATAAAIGTPTKTNLRSRNLRAGSEAKSTPPPTTRSTRVTRASSVDPVNAPNESVGTPVKRRTRASIVPAQQTVTEEEEEEAAAKIKTPESLNNTVVDVGDDSENESASIKGKSNKKGTKERKEIGTDSGTDQSNLDTPKMSEENMTDKSCTSNDSNEDSTLKAHPTHSNTSKLESFTSSKKENFFEKIDQTAISESFVLLTNQNLIKPDESHSNRNENNCDSVKSKIDMNDDECEHVDVENFTFTDDSIDVVNSPKRVDPRDTLTLDIKDSYVKLDRTNLVEKIISEKLEEDKNNDNDNLSEKINDSNSLSQNNVITNAKTAIVLVNDFVKSNEYFKNMKDQQIFDSGISLNNREDRNSNNSMRNSDDQLSIVSVDDNDEILSLKLSSPNERESWNEKLIVEVLPDDEKNDFDGVTDRSVSTNVNNVIIQNFSSKKSDVCLKENVSENKLKSGILFGEKNGNQGNFGALNIVSNNVVEITDEIGDKLPLEKSGRINCLELVNASGDNVDISNSLPANAQHDDSVTMDVDDDAIVSVNVKSPIVDNDLTATEFKDDEAKNEVAESSEIERACEFSKAKNDVGSDGKSTIEKNDSVNNIKAEQSNRVTDTNEQLEVITEPSESDPSNSKDNRDIASPCVFNETNSNEIEPKLSLEDKNAVPSAVTDADGDDNASSPIKEEERQHETSTDTTSTKSPEKSKRKSRARVIDSDLDESAENLFQDIPAEEWSEQQSKRQSNEIGNSSICQVSEVLFSKDTPVFDKSDNGADYGGRKRIGKSFGENGLDKSVLEVTNKTESQEADLSLSKKGRKSLEKKRESGQSSDSGIQDGNKTVVDNDADEKDNATNESQSRRSLDCSSIKANRSLSAQDNNDSIVEKLPKSLVDRKSLNNSRKSLNNSSQFNVSVFDNFRKKNDSLSASLNASRRQSLSDTRKSIVAKNTDKKSEPEAMDVDEAGDSENELNKSNDSPNKSRKSSTRSNSKSLDKSSRKSLIEQIQEEKIINSEEIEVDCNKSPKETDKSKSLSKSQNSFNESPTQSDGLPPTSSSNESKTSKKRLSEEFNEAARGSVVEEKSEGEELEVDVVSDKSPNKSRKNLDVSSNNKSLKEKSNKKSANESLHSCNVVVDDNSESEVESSEDDEKENKSSSKSPKRTFNVKDAQVPEDSTIQGSPNKKKGQEASPVPPVLDRSLHKSIERMKFTNPPKHNISTIVQVNSNSEEDSDDSGGNQVPSFIFKLSDEEDSMESSDEEGKEENEVDSDIEREYNLEGKSITKYSDDNVPGDDCRASEEESSDDEDDGADLQDFVIPDEELEDDEDEGDADGDEGDEAEDDEDEDDDANKEENVDADEDDNENEDEDGDEKKYAKIRISTEKKVTVSKKRFSVSSTQSAVKRTSVRKSGSFQSSGSETDDEATEVENKSGHEGFDESEKLMQDPKGKKSSLRKKHEGMDKSSKSTKSNVSSSSESSDGSIPNGSQTKVTDKSMNVSVKSSKSLNSSKSNNEKSASSRFNRNKSMQIASPSETESESEEGEDYYRIVNVESRDASLRKPKSKKLIDCSTPKPGAAKKTDFSKDNLSITASRRKSGSLNDLSDSKVMSSRLSIGEAASNSMKTGDTSMKLKDDVEIVATPDTVGKTRQAWKLIPLNQTAHPAVEDTPGTKFLKKAKLNDSFPVLESMKSGGGDLSTWSATKKKSNKGAAEREEPAVEFKKSKKRKLLDMSNALSIDEDSIVKVSKSNKKRARFDDSALVELAATEQEGEVEQGKKKQKNKKNKKKQQQQPDGKSTTDTGTVAQALKSKKKKKSQVNEAEVCEATEGEEEDVPKEFAEKPMTKRKKELVSAQEGNEQDENVKPEKPRKEGSTADRAKQVESQKRAKKSKKQIAESSGDEAPERSVGFEGTRRQELEGATAAESLKKKRRDEAGRVRQDGQSKSLKRLPEDVLDGLTDEPLRRPDKRQKLSRNRERSVIMPSKSMFSPGKVTPENLRVDDGYIPLSSAGGTTQFAVVNLRKAKKVPRKSAAALNFRDKMLARNARMPTAVYLSYLKKQKAKRST